MAEHIPPYPSGINFWSIVGEDNIEKSIYTTPENFYPSRFASEKARQARLTNIKEFGLPFAFFYKLPSKTAGDGPQAIIDVFPETHGAAVVESDGWKLMMNGNTPVRPPMRTVIGSNRTRAVVRTQSGARQANQLLPAVVGGGLIHGQSKQEPNRQYLMPLQATEGAENPLLANMKNMMFSSSIIPAALVLNDDVKVQVVMPDFIGPQEKE